MSSSNDPKYLELFHSGELLKRITEGYARLAACDICPHACGVNRLAGSTGRCGVGKTPRIASANLHRGEEPPISGTRGSGTIFLSGCTLGCKFCQNFPISQLRNGTDLTTGGLADKMVGLQRRGAHNINFVTPSHFTPQILAALYLAIRKGFRLPLVWNTSGYESLETLRLLDGVVDIYLPDMKYTEEEPAVRFSGAPGYREVNRKAVAEMLRQVGHLEVDEDGIGVRGLIVRHLVLPEGNAGSAETLAWIADNLGEETHIALMSQFFPAHAAAQTQGIHRKVTAAEYAEAVEALEENGLENGWVQDEPEES
ncbi:radical SAM protein [Geomesophilobacter sediminis]|uniref:Radical SAM protein n=1 Tax=Geomesophilobacter sediminis TaxID=2798584 RepID=A0A8J7LXW7_9BACT|nr:radical SAM protein [Geomesophilobacter sediminis]MBJ6723826.1 radical SAM protein [Geomesophilobacter sediminis]